MNLDEVYQAALAAGSGGIRYNDNTKSIQLMDTEKNWIDWKTYDAYSSFEYIASRRNENSLTCSAPYTGLYLLIMTYWGSTPVVNTTGQVITLVNLTAPTGNTSSKVYLVAIVCDTDTNMKISHTNSAGYSQIAVFYFGSRFTNANLQNYSQGYDMGAAPKLTISANNHVLIGAVSGQGATIQNYNCSTQESYASTYFACGATIRNSGTIEMNIPANNYGASLIADVLLS